MICAGSRTLTTATCSYACTATLMVIILARKLFLRRLIYLQFLFWCLLDSLSIHEKACREADLFVTPAVNATPLAVPRLVMCLSSHFVGKHVPVFVCFLFWAAGVSGFAESTLTLADAVGEDRPL